METITVERDIAAPIADVFQWCNASPNWHRSRWVLRNRLVRPGEGDPYGVGAIRIHLWLIGWFRERITAYDFPHSSEYVVERSFPPARHVGGRMSFTATPAGTHVTWTTTTEVRIPLVGRAITRWPVKPILAVVFGNILDKCAAALTVRASG